MIPFIFVTWSEFKKVFTCKYKPIVYLKLFFLYSIYGSIIYYLINHPFLYFENINLNSIDFIFLMSTLIFINFILRALFVRLPNKLKENEVIDENFRNNTSILIPCHNSHYIIEDTIISCIKHYNPENIYIVENDNHPEPKILNTQVIAEKYKVNYYYIPRGNKANAMKIALNDIHTKYCITLDDDTILPDNFVPKEDYFLNDDRVAGVSFLIRMRYQDNILRQLVDEDYKMYGYFNYTKNYSTIPFIVGIGGIWKTELFKLATEINPADDIVPYGNDGYEGMVLRLNNYKMKQDLQNYVLSYCPDRLFFSFQEFLCIEDNMSGYGATNIWKQRSLRWFRSSYAKFFINLYLLFTYYSKGKNICDTIYQNIHYRIHSLYSLLLSLLGIYIPINIYFNFTNIIDYLYLHLGLYIVGLLIMIISRLFLFRKRPDLLPKYKSIVLYPLFTTYIMLIRTCAFIGVLTFYLPVYLNFTFCNCCRYNQNNIKNIMINRINNIKNDYNKNNNTYDNLTLELQVLNDK